MRVLLRADVDNLGHKGDIVEVADGYARNFLVPRGLALRASAGIQKQADAMRRNREARRELLTRGEGTVGWLLAFLPTILVVGGIALLISGQGAAEHGLGIAVERVAPARVSRQNVSAP